MRELSWKVEQTQKGTHVKMIPPFGKELVVASLFSNDPRVYKNILSDVRRCYKVNGITPPL